MFHLTTLTFIAIHHYKDFLFLLFSAMVLETERDDDGEEIPLKWYDYLLHFLTFMWKILFAFIPPK